MQRVVAVVVLVVATSVIAVDVLREMSSASVFDDLNIGPPLKVDVLEIKFDGRDFLPGTRFYKDQVEALNTKHVLLVF